MDNELQALEQYIEEVRARIDCRRRLRDLNCPDGIKYPDEIALKELDSSIKKNSAFVKRLKGYTESQKGLILEEIDKLNSKKFISEVAGSIVEAKLKLTDIPSVIEICTKLNRIYKEFNRHLFDQYSKSFPSIKRKNIDITSTQNEYSTSNHSSISNQQNVTNNSSKIRVDLRLFSELILSGIIPLKDGYPVLVNLLCYLMIHDKLNHQNLNTILTFCKGCGDEFMGLVPLRIRQLTGLTEIPTSDYVPTKKQERIKVYVIEYYRSQTKYAKNLQVQLNELILRNKKRNDSSKDPKEQIDTKRVEYQKFSALIQQLADLLGEQSPDIVDVESFEDNRKAIENELDVSLDFFSPNKGSIWEDDGSRSFYEDLLDLKTVFPNLVERVSGPKKGATLTNNDKDSDGLTVEKLETNNENPGINSISPECNVNIDSDGDDLDKTIQSTSSEESLNGAGCSEPNQSKNLIMSPDVAKRVQPDKFFARLSNCVNRDMIDNAAIDFIKFFNTKFGRRKLVKTLFNVQRTRLDLLPFFARLTATLERYSPSIGVELVSLLKTEFRNLFKKKDQINIESKVKNVRFIGELVKFDVYPKQDAVNCLKMLLSDFTHHHIEMTCNLLETCGRALFRSPETHHSLKLILEQMMRKKLLLTVDSKYVTMIENAYYFTNPPEVIRKVVEEPPVQTYVRYLLYECLNRSTIDKVLSQIKKLNFNDRGLAIFVINCMTEAYNVKFYNIRYLAALLSALNKNHEWISIAVVDGVVEDILLMMELNELQFNQRRIPMIRYFGELFNYRISDSSLVFKILYSLITYGVHYPNEEDGQILTQVPISQLDQPDNLFRIKLVCDLLDTCGQYLSSGLDKKKLDCYLLFFQRYYWLKKHLYSLNPLCMAKSGNRFPASVEYLYNDAIFNLRPSFPMSTSLEEATRAVRDFIDSLMDDG